MTPTPSLKLTGFSFPELFHSTGLSRLDQTFLAQLKMIHPDFHEKLLAYRSESDSLNSIEISELLIGCAEFLEEFIGSLFNIEEALALTQAKTIAFNPLSAFKKYFVLRRARKELSKTEIFPAFTDLNEWLSSELKKAPLQTEDKELAVSLLGTQYLSDPTLFANQIEKLAEWSTQALATPEGQQFVSGWVTFHLPQKIDPFHLVPAIAQKNDACGRLMAPPATWHERDGFKLTDPRINAREIQD